MAGTSPTVAVCVADPAARRLVLDSARREGVASRAISLDNLRAECNSPVSVSGARVRDGSGGPWDILVYEIEPHDETAVELIECLTQHRPALQVLIYAHSTPGLGRLITAAFKLDGVSLVLRFDDGRDRFDLPRMLREVLNHQPARMIHTLIRLLLGSTSRQVDQFIGQALEQVRTTALTGSVRVADICRVVGGTPRNMGRTLALTALPQPKELLQWLTLLLCLQLMEASTDIEVTPQRPGYCGGKRLYRLRRGLIGNRRAPGKTLDHEFDIAFLAFAERCQVPVQHAAHVLQDRCA